MNKVVEIVELEREKQKSLLDKLRNKGPKRSKS